MVVTSLTFLTLHVIAVKLRETALYTNKTMVGF